MAGLFRKLFRIGKLPAELRSQAEAEGVLHLDEYIRVWVRFTGTVPGRTSIRLLRGYGGALVVTNRRVLGTVSALPGRSGRAVDQPWTAPQSGAVRGTLSETGLLLDISDLSLVDPQFSGTLSVTCKSALSPEVLSRLPTRAIAFDVPPMFVYSLLGVRGG